MNKSQFQPLFNVYLEFLERLEKLSDPKLIYMPEKMVGEGQNLLFKKEIQLKQEKNNEVQKNGFQ